MKYIFSGMGGSGSTALLRALGQRFYVDARPDTYFILDWEPSTPLPRGLRTGGGPVVRRAQQEWRRVLHPGRPLTGIRPRRWHLRDFFVTRSVTQAIPGGTLEVPADPRAARAFQDLTRFRFDSGATIASNLLRYIGEVQGDPSRTVLFNSIGKFRFFSRHEVDGLVTLTRHPLHAYLSLTKPVRHLNLVEGFGGPDTIEGVEYFAHHWNADIDESRRLKDRGGRLVRFEYIREDAAGIAELDGLFDEWDPAKRNPNGLSAPVLARLRELTRANYERLYPSWEL